jgi:hypothetical protein
LRKTESVAAGGENKANGRRLQIVAGRVGEFQERIGTDEAESRGKQGAIAARSGSSKQFNCKGLFS